MAAEPIYNTVVDIVAGEIVSGRIQPGVVLSLVSLQQDFSISRTVAREVMRMLESVGMVHPQRSVGLVVLPTSDWDVLDARVIEWRLNCDGRETQLRSLSELRAAVEPMAAAAAARNASREQRTRIVELAERLTELGDQGESQEFLEADIAFHRLLLTASGNELFAALRDVFTVTLAGRVRHGLMPIQPRPEALAWHVAVASAVARADAAAAFELSGELLAGLRAELFGE